MIKFLRHVFVDDFWLKLFSLLLALLFWMTVSFAIQQKETLPMPALSLTSEVRRFFNVPVQIVSSTADVRSFKVTPDHVELKVQGDAPVIENLRSKDVRAMVDLTGFETFPILRRPIEVSAPAGVTILNVLPQEAQVVPPPKPAAR